MCGAEAFCNGTRAKHHARHCPVLTQLACVRAELLQHKGHELTMPPYDVPKQERAFNHADWSEALNSGQSPPEQVSTHLSDRCALCSRHMPSSRSLTQHYARMHGQVWAHNQAAKQQAKRFAPKIKEECPYCHHDVKKYQASAHATTCPVILQWMLLAQARTHRLEGYADTAPLVTDSANVAEHGHASGGGGNMEGNGVSKPARVLRGRGVRRWCRI